MEEKDDYICTQTKQKEHHTLRLVGQNHAALFVAIFLKWSQNSLACWLLSQEHSVYN